MRMGAVGPVAVRGYAGRACVRVSMIQALMLGAHAYVCVCACVCKHVHDCEITTCN